MTFIECSLDNAITQGCDCCQYKHDGMFVTFRVSRGTIMPENRFGQSEDIPLSVPFGGNAVLVGTYHPHTKERWVYDIRSQNGISLVHEAYRSRYVILRVIAMELGGTVTVSPVHPIGMAREMWQKLPLGGAKGLVFRDSKSKEMEKVYGARFYPEVPRAL